MDVTVASTLIGVSGSLVGALVGGAASYVATSRLHRKQVQKEREDARRDREHQAAKQCEELCVRMADDMEMAEDPLHSKHGDAEQQREERVRKASRQLGAVSLYLPDELRARVENIGEIISEADALGYGSHQGGPTHYDSPYTICWNGRKEIRAITAAFLKGESLPEREPVIHEYVVALKDLNSQYADFYSNYEDSPQEQARRRNLEDFYKKHPELRPAA